MTNPVLFVVFLRSSETWIGFSDDHLCNESRLGKTQVTWALPVNLPFANLNPLAVPVIYIVGRTHATGGWKTAIPSPAGGGRLGWRWLCGFGQNRLRVAHKATLSPALSRWTGEGAGCRLKLRSSENFEIWVLEKLVHPCFQTTFY